MNLPHEYRNRAEDEPETPFVRRIKTLALFGLAALLVLIVFIALDWFGIGLEVKFSAQKNSKGLAHISNASTQRDIQDLGKSLDSESKHRRKIESELKLAYGNSKNFSHDKVSIQRELKELRNSLKLAHGNLEGLRRDKDKSENDIKSKRESPATISCSFPAARIRFPRWKENNECAQLGNSRK
ncbi:hypothetical protein DdX_18199 [Ditylenchus destructor]|uniref:Uncharacterized protein n=1 Tax=Ditylenchus destructor TaxID=166010 RepID=A0AAD4ML69_9BILA|nr:hypothetical protein DdX_18199 [Ditylenchus destructor]